MSAGVYTITSPSGKRYVGSAVNFKRRWKLHLHNLVNGKHHNAPLAAAAAKHGIDALKFEIVFRCAPCEVLLYEQAFIDGLRPEMNVLKVAGSALGHRWAWTAESRARASEQRKGRPVSMEARARMSEARRGVKQTPEAIAARVAGRAGWKHSEETKQKMSLRYAK